jgi:trimeric autotransporter adhesin
MANDNEPRALGAALAAPAFVTRGHGVALHTANRHVERWAPEATAGRVRSMRSLGFVDRLVAPWIETAQRSASLRLFTQYAHTGPSERAGGSVSWVFPRPWYQDELDWMAAARHVPASTTEAPRLLTTRGTYVTPSDAPSSIAAPPMVMPSALYEHVAPSLSIAAPSTDQPGIGGVGFGGDAASREAYSPLISLAAVQAAELMSRTIAPLAMRPGGAAGVVTPQLRSVLSSILARAATPRPHELPTTRLALSAPHLETPPAPSPAGLASEDGDSAATQVAERYAEQRARIAELQRIAQQSAQREAAARAAVIAQAAARATEPARGSTAAPAAPDLRDARDARTDDATRAPSTAQAAASAELRAAAARAEQELRRRAGEARGAELQRQADAASVDAAERTRAAETAERARTETSERARLEAERSRLVEAAERARLEERIAQRVAERTGGQRLHEQARAAAAADARSAASTERRPEIAAPAALPVEPRVSAEVTAAVSDLPPELAAILRPAVAQRPERALQVISELNETLRTVELLARSSAVGGAFEPTRGPRLVMPAGLGGLVNAVDRAQAMTDRSGGGRAVPSLRPLVEPPSQDLLVGARAASAGAAAQRARAAREVRVPALPWLTGSGHSLAAAGQSPAGAGHSLAPAPTTALGATAAATPAALSHVAWADRWLARFAGATPESLDVMRAAAAAPALRMQALAQAAPEVVFVAPELLRGDLVGGASAAPGTAAGAAPAYGLAAASPAVSAGAPTFGAVPATAERMPRLINPMPSEPVRRFDDEAETPDDVFAAIAAAASRGRVSPRTEAAAVAAASAPAPAPAQQAAARATLADLVAHSAPPAPGAGMSAQLASSPFAPALRHVLALPSAATFDVRSLFGSALGATYLAGLLGTTSQELEIGAQRVPTWASWSEAPLAHQLSADRIDRLVPEFEAAYVSPSELDRFDDAGEGAATAAALAARAAAASIALTPSTTPSSALSPGLPVDERGQAPVSASAIPAVSLGAFAPASLAAEGTDGSFAARVAASEVSSLSLSPAASLTTLRSALLSWDVVGGTDLAGSAGAREDDAALQLVPGSFATPATAQGGAATYADAVRSISAARMMVDALSLPMLGDAAAIERTSDWVAPGMLAARAHAWSVAQERSSADLALDFVAPELVLAARVYGLGPAEAAQAVRLALVGPGQLGAMASTVDRTFVEALAIERDAREARSDAERRARTAAIAMTAATAAAAFTTGAPTAGAVSTAAAAPTVSPAIPAIDDTAQAAVAASAAATPSKLSEITTAFPTAQGEIAAAIAPASVPFAPASGTMAFGVDRRMPRGAFLWPSATVAALGMNAAGSDGQSSISVAALELLAARAVAELGTYSVLSEADAAVRGDTTELARMSELAARAELAPAADLAAHAAPASMIAGAAQPLARDADRQASPAVATGADLATRTRQAAVLASPGRDASGTQAEPGEAEVLGAAAAFVPPSRRSRFEALYIALSQSSAGRQWSPAARAARALALAGRGEDTPITARERAATAWDVLPVVYASDSAAVGDAAAHDLGTAAGATAASAVGAGELLSSLVAPSAFDVGGAASQPAGVRGSAPRGARRVAGPGGLVDVGAGAGEVEPGGFDGFDATYVSGPGLGRLSARAGEALGSYVTPVAPPVAPQERERRSEPTGIGAALRAPTAAPEYVHTGRSGGRHGGGEVEIPPWFEDAARRMLAEQSGSGDGISLAELTLITSAPSNQIAASQRVQPSAAIQQAASSGPAAEKDTPKIDVERLANELYRDIMVLMDIARARNGEPYL